MTRQKISAFWVSYYQPYYRVRAANSGRRPQIATGPARSDPTLMS